MLPSRSASHGTESCTGSCVGGPLGEMCGHLRTCTSAMPTVVKTEASRKFFARCMIRIPILGKLDHGLTYLGEIILAPLFLFGAFNLLRSTSGKTRRFTGCLVFRLDANPRAGRAPRSLLCASVRLLYSFVMHTPHILQNVLFRTWRPKAYRPTLPGSLAYRATRLLLG